jgi:hypothetical protein
MISAIIGSFVGLPCPMGSGFLMGVAFLRSEDNIPIRMIVGSPVLVTIFDAGPLYWTRQHFDNRHFRWLDALPGDVIFLFLPTDS